MPDTFFSIPVLLPEMDVLSFLSVKHSGDRFEMDVLGEDVALGYDGHGSWSLLEGDISDEIVKVIGEAIEGHYLKGKG